MAMGKKQFIALADALRPVLTDGMEQRGPLLDALCAFMRRENPRFNENHWREYLAGNCGPSGGKIKK